MRRLGLLAATALFACGSLAGCGSNSGAGGTIDTSYPDAGTEFDSLPDNGPVTRAYVDFQVAAHRSLLKAEVDPALAKVATTQVATTTEASVAHLEETGGSYHGTWRFDDVKITDESDSSATVEACLDLSALKRTDAGEEASADAGRPRAPQRVTLTKSGDAWRVSKLEDLDRSC